MSNFTDFISGGGGGGGSPFPTMVFQESTTWACPVAMEAMVYVIGAGGSGAFYASNANHNAGGGGAGGCAVSKLTLAAQNYTLTIGSGGAEVVGYNLAHGNDGGASSMSGSGMTTMTANGGTGGRYTTASSGSGSTGGTATGGTLYNNTGGGVPVNTPTTAFSKSGGGAVGLYAAGEDGTWEQSNQKLAEGGKIMGSSISSSESISAVNFNLIYKKNMPVVSDTFPGLKFRYGLGTASNTSPQGYDISSGAYSRKATVSSQVHISPSGPFCGGAGYGGSDSVQQFAASGIAGGGGGGMSQETARYGYSGGGGGGIIIICPISMGA